MVSTTMYGPKKVTPWNVGLSSDPVFNAHLKGIHLLASQMRYQLVLLLDTPGGPKGTYHRVRVEPDRHALCRRVRIVNLLPFGLPKCLLFLRWHQRSAIGLCTRAWPPRTVYCLPLGSCTRHHRCPQPYGRRKSRLDDPEVAVRRLVVREPRQRQRRKAKRIPTVSVRSDAPGCVEGEFDDRTRSTPAVIPADALESSSVCGAPTVTPVSPIALAIVSSISSSHYF